MGMPCMSCSQDRNYSAPDQCLHKNNHTDSTYVPENPSAPIPCFVCIEPLENVFSDVENQPYKGTTFTSYGHYGSTIFDPMDNTRLTINICDKCLEARSDQVLLSKFSHITKTYQDYEDWNPTEGEGNADKD